MKARLISNVIVAVAVAMACANAHAQSLEKSYADMCSTSAQKQTETCQVMAKALVAKLQGESVAAPVASGASHGQARLDQTRLLALWRERWGFLVDFVGRPTFAIDAATGKADTLARSQLEWEVPGAVLVRRNLAPDGSLAGLTRYRWDEQADRVVRDLPALHGTQDFSINADGSLTGVVQGTNGVVRETWKQEADSYNVWSEANSGQGWIPASDSYFFPATDNALSNAAQLAKTLAQVHQARKQAAEVHAAMQGSKTDEEYKAYLVDLAARAKAWEEGKQARREARARMFGALLVAGAGVAAAIANGGDTTQVMDAAMNGYSGAAPPAAQRAATGAGSRPASGSGESIMGFNGKTCADARAGAQQWVGSNGTFQVKSEVMQPDGRCVVQIHNWHSSGGASYQ